MLVLMRNWGLFMGLWRIKNGNLLTEPGCTNTGIYQCQRIRQPTDAQ